MEQWYRVITECPDCHKTKLYKTTNYLLRIGNVFNTGNKYFNNECYQCRIKPIITSILPSYKYGIWNHSTHGKTNSRPQFWMILNQFHKKCWCGKPRIEFDKYQRRHCTSRHGALWSYYICTTWPIVRHRIIQRDNSTCVVCKNYTDAPEVDHIVAKALGGDEWDNDNLRTLCHECHRIKTKQDMTKLRERKKNKLANSIQTKLG